MLSQKGVSEVMKGRFNFCFISLYMVYYLTAPIIFNCKKEVLINITHLLFLIEKY